MKKEITYTCPHPTMRAEVIFSVGPPPVYTATAHLRECPYRYAGCPLFDVIKIATGATAEQAIANAKANLGKPRKNCPGFTVTVQQ